MNYYIQGCAAKADKIRAAFEKLGYDVTGFDMCNDNILFFTYKLQTGANVISTTNAHLYTANIIKTHPDFQELELHVQPKFKVGDWITSIDDEGDTAVERIVNLRDNKVLLVDIDGCFTEYPRGTLESYRLWTIADAKDGDVITNGKMIVIFNKLEEPTYRQHIIAYVGLDSCGRLQITKATWQLGVGNAIPATKEQRDLLFKKMKEAGYQWDADKKELKKIKPHYDISNFKPFDKVLVRCSNDEEWMIEFYCKYDTLVHTSPHRDYPFMGIGDSYSQCIPFEGNEHLLGTTDMPSEEFINW